MVVEVILSFMATFEFCFLTNNALVCKTYDISDNISRELEIVEVGIEIAWMEEIFPLINGEMSY